MTAVAPTLQAFFLSRLGRELDASAHTVDSYRHAFRLLLVYAHTETGKAPSELNFSDLDARLVSNFLDHLEKVRGNTAGTRNTRLAAIHSFFHYAAYRHPEHARSIQQVLAIPHKKAATVPRAYLDDEEMDVLVAAPDRSTWMGRRDHALLVVGLRTGMRLSELTGLRRRDVDLGPAPHVKCLGKGRKRRDTPLDKATVAVLKAWTAEAGSDPDAPLFPSLRGGRLSPDAVERLIAKHVAAAKANCPGLGAKKICTHKFAPQLRHGDAPARGRRGGPRPSARSREAGVGQRIPARRPDPETEGARPTAAAAAGLTSGALPARRPAAAVPRATRIMPPLQASARALKIGPAGPRHPLVNPSRHYRGVGIKSSGG